LRGDRRRVRAARSEEKNDEEGKLFNAHNE
jgi:hypothetical protein